jgi:hypothetical protein
MKRTAWKNLDGAIEQEKTATRSPSRIFSMSFNPHYLNSIPDDRCVTSLDKLGFKMGSSRIETTLAIKDLKSIDIDISKVTPKKDISKKSHQTQTDPFDASEDEDTESNNALLAHLVQDVSEVYFDDEALDTKICDLMASSRKARTSKKMAKKKQKKKLVLKGLYWNSRGLLDLAKHRYIVDAIKERKLDFVAIMESGKQDMQRTNLSQLSGGAYFIWHCLSPRGRSGGNLLGVNAAVLQISMIIEGDFFYKISSMQ